jgi:hypothetical protein
LSIQNNNEFLINAQCSYTIDGIEVYNVCSSEFDFLLEEPGIHEVTYSIAIGNSFADTTIQIEVYAPSPQPVITYSELTHELVCSNCTDDNLAWYFNGFAVQQSSSSTFNAEIDGITQNGNYTLITTNSDGCQTASASLAICQPHLAVSSTSGCAPLTVYFNNLTDTITGMVCTLNTGISMVEDFSGQEVVNFESPGTYNATIACNTSDAAGEFTVAIDVAAVESPILAVDELNGTVVCTNSAAFTEFSWNIDGEIIPGGSSQPLGGDVYQLQAYNAAGCGGVNLLIVNDISETSSSGITAYPNPAHEAIQIQAETAGSLSIFNSAGTLVYSSNKQSVRHVIDTQLWPTGLYFVRWNDGPDTDILKFEVNH